MARHYATLKAAMEAFRSQQNARLKQLSVARLLGQAIRSIHEETSVSSLFV